ncbi:hypothetical protein L6164_004368 [Bauhinia variegata]|uniref:Uncharacterized protein n=1 Tax=Bauhinia variegata TaxID=167791 RepID=A0ACB9Q4D5_BAUVA|nr:hypothetical protein L6164_004368 [Bauhinia variegata]
MSGPMESSNPSFTFVTTTAQKNLLRSNSTQEPQFPHFSPPRLSCPAHSRSLGSSPLSSPRHHHCPALPPDHELSDPQTTYHCAYSLLRRDAQILSIALSNGLVYTGYGSNVIRVWKLPEFTECAQIKTKASRVEALEVSNHIIYAACGDGKIRMWRRTWDRLVLKHVRLGSIPKTVGYIRNYIAGRDKTMKHKGPITSIAINTVEDILYSASMDKTLKVWRISDLRCIETFTAHHEPINCIMVGGDGVLYTASDDATVKVWRRNFCSHGRPHSLIFTLHAKYSPVKALTLSPDGGVLYGGCSDGYIHYWLKDWLTGQLQYGGSMQGHTHAVMCLASVADYVVSGSADSTSRVWFREDGQHTCLTVLVGHRGPIRCTTAYRGEDSADDNCTVCTGSLDGVLKVWRVTSTHKKNEKLCSSQNGGQHQ